MMQKEVSIGMLLCIVYCFAVTDIVCQLSNIVLTWGMLLPDFF